MASGNTPPVRWDALGADPEPLLAPEPTPETTTLSAETRGVIERAIRALPERQRTVLVLRDVGGWPANEVCALVGVSTGNQRVLLHRARAAVRATLTPYLDDLGRTVGSYSTHPTASSGCKVNGERS